jgi:hypothetical protein
MHCERLRCGKWIRVEQVTSETENCRLMKGKKEEEEEDYDGGGGGNDDDDDDDDDDVYIFTCFMEPEY